MQIGEWRGFDILAECKMTSIRLQQRISVAILLPPHQTVFNKPAERIGTMSLIEWKIETDVSDDEIRQFLATYAPWRTKVTFNDRISTEEFGIIQPFSATPLNKIRAAEKHLPKSALGGRVLDVGCNNGYNSITLAREYGAKPTGYDFNKRHPEVASKFAKLLKVEAEFLVGDAEKFVRPNSYDLVLHFGTLYHLPNPLLSLKLCAENLVPGGWLALETAAFIGGADPHENMFFQGYHGDSTNWWALSKATIEKALGLFGFEPPKLILEVHPKIYEGRYSRVIYVAQKRLA